MLGHTEQRADLERQACLLAQFPRQARPQAFAGFDMPAGEKGKRLSPSPREEDLAVMLNHGAGEDMEGGRRRHSGTLRRGRQKSCGPRLEIRSHPEKIYDLKMPQRSRAPVLPAGSVA